MNDQCGMVHPLFKFHSGEFFHIDQFNKSFFIEFRI